MYGGAIRQKGISSGGRDYAAFRVLSPLRPRWGNGRAKEEKGSWGCCWQFCIVRYTTPALRCRVAAGDLAPTIADDVPLEVRHDQ